MRNIMLAPAAALLMGLANPVLAGRYSCDAYGDLGCANHIKDIVTDQFTSFFPSSKYTIVVVYNAQRFDDGSAAIWAVAGVSPKFNGSDLSLMPVNRFSSVYYTDKKPSASDLEEFQIRALRGAIESLMASCERDCASLLAEANSHTPRLKSVALAKQP